jgi:hypothetical protein
VFAGSISDKSVGATEMPSGLTGIVSGSKVVGRNGCTGADAVSENALIEPEMGCPQSSLGATGNAPEFEIANLSTNVCCVTRAALWNSEGASFNDLMIFLDGSDLSVPEDLRSSVRVENCPTASVPLFVSFAKLSGTPSNVARPLATAVSGIARDNELNRADAKPLPSGVPFEFANVFVIVNSFVICAAEFELEIDSVTIGPLPPRYRYAHWRPKSIRIIVAFNTT